MTLIPMWKKCPKCHRMYSWNPDVGNLFCPDCGLFSLPGNGLPGRSGNGRKEKDKDKIKDRILEAIFEKDNPWTK